jgi:hypothetical protein
MDFEIFLNDVPQYTLNDFRDAKTTFISLEIHEDNLFNNQKQLNSILYGFDGAISGDIEAQNITDMVREHFLAVFLDCYDIIARSIFAQAYIIVDLESGLLTVDKDTLTLKHSYKMSKEEITNEYAAIVQQIDGTVESLDVFSTEYMNECFCQFENIPYRVMFYISPSKCRIKLLYNKENLFPKIKNIPTSSEYSSSDADESVTAREGETLFPDYDSSDDVPF